MIWERIKEKASKKHREMLYTEEAHSLGREIYELLRKNASPEEVRICYYGGYSQLDLCYGYDVQIIFVIGDIFVEGCRNPGAIEKEQLKYLAFMKAIIEGLEEEGFVVENKTRIVHCNNTTQYIVEGEIEGEVEVEGEIKGISFYMMMQY